MDYVTRNLSEPLPLEEVAKAACFSPYHFHRIFNGLMGETLAAFVKRIRLERAVYLLSHRSGASLTEIALACGFSSNSVGLRTHAVVCPRQQKQAAHTPQWLRAEHHYRLDRCPVKILLAIVLLSVVQAKNRPAG